MWEWSMECSRSVVENGEWQRQRSPELEDAPAASFHLLSGSILDLVLPMMTAVKWWIKLRLCASTVQHLLLMLAATPPICHLIYRDITPVCQLTAQGGVSRVGENNFYSPQRLNSTQWKVRPGKIHNKSTEGAHSERYAALCHGEWCRISAFD